MFGEVRWENGIAFVISVGSVVQTRFIWAVLRCLLRDGRDGGSIYASPLRTRFVPRDVGRDDIETVADPGGEDPKFSDVPIGALEGRMLHRRGSDELIFVRCRSGPRETHRQRTRRRTTR